VKSLAALRPSPTALRLGALALAAQLTACSTIEGMFSGDKVDYRSGASNATTKGLEVPPDLTQLSRESRYQLQGGVVSAAAAGATPAANAAPVAAAAGTATVALNSVGGLHVERQGQQRWLVAPQTPEQLWPQVKAFWEQRGLTVVDENAAAGVMETDWAENRVKLPMDIIRRTLGKLIDSAYDSGERDRYRTRIERTASGSEIYISHRGLQEVYTSERKDATAWRARPNDPELEAEMLARLMVTLGSKDVPSARTAVAAATPASAPGIAGSRPVVEGGATTLTLTEPFDRAWRRVGLALDRSGFTVEDRDRSAGLYYVRYVDPKNAGKEEPGWWARLWGDKSNPQAALRYRVAVKTAAEKTTVSVQNSAGAAETGDIAQRIVGQLASELSK
jgi:outer membrane protein assembly factor BamC